MVDGALAGGEFTEAVFAPAYELHAGLFHGVHDHLAGFARFNGVHGLVAVGVVGHEEGQGGKVEFLHLGRPVDGGGKGEVDGAAADEQQFGGLLAGHELSAGVHLDVDAAVRALTDEIGEIRCGKAPAGGGGGHHAQLVFLLVGGGRSGQQTHACGGQEGGTEKTLHKFLLGYILR